MKTKFVVFNNFGLGEPDEFHVFDDMKQATEFMQYKGDEWDVTDFDTFKEWYPHLVR